jgi:hypothetical protein
VGRFAFIGKSVRGRFNVSFQSGISTEIVLHGEGGKKRPPCLGP